MALSISLTGISPLHGSHPALPIACDASNARTVAVGEYHYVFCAVMACKVLRLLCGRIFLARLPCREVSWRILRTAKAQKESVRFALCCAAVILRRFLCQGSEWLCCRVSSGTEKGERESVPPPLRFIPLP